MYSDKLSKKLNKTQTTFTIIYNKTIKKQTKVVRDIYSNYKNLSTPRKETEENTKKWNYLQHLWISEIIIVKWLYCWKNSTDSMQSLSKP